MTLSIPVSPVKWWNMYYNIIAGYAKAKKYYGSVLSSFEAGGLGMYTSQTFTLPANITFELSAFYGTGGLFGVVKIDPAGVLNAGLQKKFGDQTILRVGYDDVFHTLKYSGESDLPQINQYFRAYFLFQQPTFKISFTQNFGNQKMKGKRERQTGAE
ncbi:MAG: outer membrane beta-barrel family protein, partial [Bacteroidota bacterium]|nr:outer membrane beta-barrel family protein [Bacteroidota bacterium]